MVNLNAIKTFLAVIDLGTVVAAARAYGYSPAAVSRHLSWLQRQLGVTLFVPDGRSIAPTDDALEFAEQARVFVREAARFEAYVRAVGRGGGALTPMAQAFSP